ncbi:MAG TPA: chemotaxis protein CheB, partial [Polyangia bacterium]|nr:chemotaxis protein CheB [Polyangia bacterium]
MAKRARSKGGSQPLAKRGARRIATPGPAGTPSQGNGVPVRVSADSVDPGAGFLVVGVGASAGGLEAFSTLLRGIPQDTPIALVFVQHLAADHRSLLPELLGAVSAFPVEQARDGVAIRPGHVYVIPPDARMTVNDGHLALAARAGGYASAIDHFLVSLADQYRERSVGVVLTGGGHDGATGIREIKAAGGITMVQSPAEAAMDSMPRAAIATGAVDLVMPLGRIAEQLAELSRHPFLKHPAAEAAGALDAQDERLRRLFQLLRRSSGVDFSQYKPATLVRRIQRRMALHRLSSAEAYLAFIETNPSEAEALYEDILIHVTSFFREPESFEILKERILP